MAPRVMIDGGPGAEPEGELNAGLVTDERGELIRELRTLARTRELEPHVGSFYLMGFQLSLTALFILRIILMAT